MCMCICICICHICMPTLSQTVHTQSAWRASLRSTSHVFDVVQFKMGLGEENDSDNLGSSGGKEGSCSLRPLLRGKKKIILYVQLKTIQVIHKGCKT